MNLNSSKNTKHLKEIDDDAILHTKIWGIVDPLLQRPRGIDLGDAPVVTHPQACDRRAAQVGAVAVAGEGAATDFDPLRVLFAPDGPPWLCAFVFFFA